MGRMGDGRRVSRICPGRTGRCCPRWSGWTREHRPGHHGHPAVMTQPRWTYPSPLGAVVLRFGGHVEPRQRALVRSLGPSSVSAAAIRVAGGVSVGQVVVPAVALLHEGVSGDDRGRGGVGTKPDWSESVFELAVVGLDRIVGVTRAEKLVRPGHNPRDH